ncbi:MAG: MarR family transcriptional regulator [Caldiserica bacterium]|jgi:DNA-binding MarR family transcriptional regulator|nr:MarR family transcriptional regulator [Caldisericota bacterium]MDH7562620.1 MarR family transcriptional regulator [Caldisericota bacterium]
MQMDELAQILGTIFFRLGVHKTKTGSKLGLTNLQLEALQWIAENDGQTLGDLARARSFLRPSVTRIVDALEGDGLAKRKVDPQDRRAIRIFITPKGKKLISKLKEEVSAILEELLALMSQKEKEALLKGLVALIEADRKFDALKGKKNEIPFS